MLAELRKRKIKKNKYAGRCKPQIRKIGNTTTTQIIKAKPLITHLSMYDTVNIRLNINNWMDYISQYLKDVKPTKRAFKNGLPEIEGYAENIKVIANDRFITLIGSISKFLKGDNVFCVGANDTKLAIEKISDWLHLPFENAYLLRIDVSNSINVMHNPIDYFMLMGNKGNYEPQRKYYNEKLNGIYYGKKPKNDKYGHSSYWTSFYKKGENLLRYELKILRPQDVLKPILGDQQPKLIHLYQPGVNNLLLLRWMQHFKKVKTIKEIPKEIDLVKKTPANYRNAKLDLLESQYPKINKELNDMLLADINKTNAIGGFKHQTQHQRCVKALEPRNICTIENPLIKELNQKVNEVYESYLI